MLLNVEADGDRWLCDVGFGGAGPLVPIPMVAGEDFEVGHWTYRLGHAGGSWILQLRQPQGWIDLYEFTVEPQYPADYEMANYFTSTHPLSGFVKTITAQLPGPDLQLVLRGRELFEYRPDGVTSRTLESDEDVLDVLAGRFGLRFPPGTRFTSPLA
jgi:N-hydroxyarylamine O-acetyltransferase